MLKDRDENEARTPRIVPERIREAREARGLTVEDFAEQIGVTRQAVAQFEVGQTSPAAQTMARVIAVSARSGLRVARTPSTSAHQHILR